MIEYFPIPFSLNWFESPHPGLKISVSISIYIATESTMDIIIFCVLKTFT